MIRLSSKIAVTAVAGVAAAMALTACSGSGAESAGSDAAQAIPNAVSETEINNDVRVMPFLNVNWGPPAGIGTTYAQSGAKEIALGFAGSQSMGPCTPMMLTGDGGIDLKAAPMKNFVAEIVTAGVKPALGFGGESGAMLNVTCTDQAALNQAFADIATEYPDIDTWLFDIEGANVYDLAAHQRLLAALNATLPQNPKEIWLVLPVAETGMTAEGIALVQATKAAGIDFKLDIMAQGFYPVPSNMVTAAENATRATVSQMQTIFPDKTEAEIKKNMGITVQIGRQPNPDPLVSIADNVNLRKFAVNYGIGGLLPWSLNTDFPDPGPGYYWSPGGSGAPDQTRNWEFTQTSQGQQP